MTHTSDPAPNQGPVVLITGCSSGIGRATAKVFLANGWRVWATARDPSDITGLDRAGCRTAALDVTEDEQVDRVATRLLDRDGRIDCLVNNAGFGQAGAIEEIPLERFRAQFDVNVFGPLRLIKKLLPQMRRQETGTIVNVSSVLGRLSYPMRGAYAGSKHALEAISDALRREVSGAGVDVVLVEPGTVRTQFDRKMRERNGSLAREAEYARLRRFLDAVQNGFQWQAIPPERVGAVIYRAAEARSPKARYTIGRDAKLLFLLDRVIPTRLVDLLFRLLGS